jgi:hypothetical protein
MTSSENRKIGPLGVPFGTLKANWAIDWIALIEGLGLAVPNHVAEDIIDSAESLYLYALVGMGSSPDPRLGILL